jgi:lipase
MHGRGVEPKLALSVAISRSDVAVPGGPLAAFRFGDQPRKAIVLAVHGITANSRSWLAVARELGDRATLIAPDLRGRGRSNALPGPYGMAAHARDVLAVLDHFGLERGLLVGHSMGAYVVARLAADQPERVQGVVLIDGGLTIPGLEGVDPQAFADAFLGPALARLKMSFESREAYREWWRRHPAFANSHDVAESDLGAYADHDMVGEAPHLRSAVSEAAVRGDAAELLEMGEPAHRLAVPATLLCAPRGLLDDPNPMQPLAIARAWADGAPDERSVVEVPDVNHYTLVFGRAGARAVAGAIVDALNAHG